MKQIAYGLCLAITLQTAVYCAVLDTIDAVVNGELILSGEVDSMVSLELKDTPNPNEIQILQARRKVLRVLIDEILILQEARQFLNDEQWNQINAQVEQLTQRRMAEQREQLRTPQDVILFEQQNRMKWEDLRKLISRQIERNVLRNEVAKRLARKQIPPPTAHELEEFKQQYPHLSPDGQIEIAHIMLKLPPNASPEQINSLRSRANELARRARSGEPFERLVQQYSQHEASVPNGGNLGKFKRNTILKDFVFMFDQPEGYISDPVVTSNSVHIVKIVDVPTWEDEYYKIKNEQNENAWMESLRKKAKVEIRHDRDLKEEFESAGS